MWSARRSLDLFTYYIIESPHLLVTPSANFDSDITFTVSVDFSSYFAIVGCLSFAKMRLIQNMSTIAEYPSAECPSNRVIKIAVIGGSGVGKTGTFVEPNIYDIAYYNNNLILQKLIYCRFVSYISFLFPVQLWWFVSSLSGLLVTTRETSVSSSSF